MKTIRLMKVRIRGSLLSKIRFSQNTTSLSNVNRQNRSDSMTLLWIFAYIAYLRQVRLFQEECLWIPGLFLNYSRFQRFDCGLAFDIQGLFLSAMFCSISDSASKRANICAQNTVQRSPDLCDDPSPSQQTPARHEIPKTLQSVSTPISQYLYV